MVLRALPTVLAIVVINFFLLQLVPGDAVDVLAAESGAATQESMLHLREQLGLDLPVLTQLVDYLGHLVRLDLGNSARHNMPVNALIGSRAVNTLLLMGTALTLAIVTGLLLGTIMATKVGRWQDRTLSVVALLLYSTPSFWLGLMAIVLFSVKLDWAPSGGVVTIGSELTGWAHVHDIIRHLILPTLATMAFYVAIFSRLIRASILEVSKLDFVRTAKAKGLNPATITLRHILRNALIPVTTVVGMYVGTMLGGAVVIEVVFSWPGMGRLALESVMARDYHVLLGILLFSSLLVIAANIAVDILQAWIDPRIQSE